MVNILGEKSNRKSMNRYGSDNKIDKSQLVEKTEINEVSEFQNGKNNKNQKIEICAKFNVYVQK